MVLVTMVAAEAPPSRRRLHRRRRRKIIGAKKTSITPLPAIAVLASGSSRLRAMGAKGRMLTNGLAVKLGREGSVEAVELAAIINIFMRDKIAMGLPAQIYRSRQAMERWKDAADLLGTARFDRHQRRWIQAV
jgi:hypothetical protein